MTPLIYLDGKVRGCPSPFYFKDGGRCEKGIPVGVAIYEGRRVNIHIENGPFGVAVRMTTLSPAEIEKDTFLTSLPAHFSYRSGSKMWPSDDPNDSPFDAFTCRYCGETIHVRMNGAFSSLDEPQEALYQLTKEHLESCLGYRVKEKKDAQ